MIDAESEQEKKDRLLRAITDEIVDEIDDNPELVSDAFAAYFADGYNPQDPNNAGGKFEIVYCEELGLAIEKPKDGFNLQQLWEVIPS